MVMVKVPMDKHW